MYDSQGIQAELVAGNNISILGRTISATVPTATSDLTNDSGFITDSYHDSSKQDTLVSGTNIKTINNESVLGSGNITISSGTSDYSDLSNKPSVNGVTLSGNKTTSDLGIVIPTKTSDLTNDSGFLTQHQSLAAYRTSADQDVIDNGKQATLVSGTNIKTINNESILGSGNITIGGS